LRADIIIPYLANIGSDTSIEFFLREDRSPKENRGAIL